MMNNDDAETGAYRRRASDWDREDTVELTDEYATEVAALRAEVERLNKELKSARATIARQELWLRTTPNSDPRSKREATLADAIVVCENGWKEAEAARVNEAKAFREMQSTSEAVHRAEIAAAEQQRDAEAHAWHAGAHAWHEITEELHTASQEAGRLREALETAKALCDDHTFGSSISILDEVEGIINAALSPTVAQEGQ